MNTSQEPPAPSVSPCTAGNRAPENHDVSPASKTNINRNLGDVHIDHAELPGRCQFAFSDGRQCRMARSEIHPSLCSFHAEREEQLFGEPGSHTFGAALDLPELHSACRDLSTPAGVHRALAEVFRLLARRRISRQEAATFGHLAYLLLRSIAAARAEAADGNAALAATNAVMWSEAALQPEPAAALKPAPQPNAPPVPSPYRQPPVQIERVEPPPGGFLMSADPHPDASSIFRRPNVPILAEERFALSASTPATSLPPEGRRSPKVPAQPAQNEHLPNLRT
jgi:hypothetical protein